MRPCSFRSAMLVLSGLVALARPAFADEPRLDPNVAPTSEAVVLNLDANQTDYTGSVKIQVHVEKATREFLFHAEEMKLDTVELSGAAGKIPVTITSGGDRGTQKATTTADLAPGDYTLAISFSKPYNTQAVGLYRGMFEGKGYLFTQFESLDARKAFPCWDEPIYKIPWDMTITVPTQQVAVFNTPVEKEQMGATTHTYIYKRTPPTSSYLLAVAAGTFESVPITGQSVPGRIYTCKGQKKLAAHAASIAPRILAAEENYFGTKYPYEKLDFIAVPEYWPGAMENPGLITFSDKILLVDPASVSLSQKSTLAMVIIHEEAHMWFGDLVTMAWWDDLWLNESFADWLAVKLMPELYPEYGYETRELQEVNHTMTQDANAITTPVRRKVDSGADIMEDLDITYKKGRTVLKMTEAFIGADKFQLGVRNYLAAHAWKNAVAADLFTALADASGKNIEPILASYLDQAGFPLVKVGVEPNGMVTLSQTRFRNAGAAVSDETWSVPVRLKISDGKNVQTRVVVLDKPTKQVEIPGKVDWVMPDDGGVGYYRWIVPSQMMMKLASHPDATMSKRERTRFLGNARALLNGGEITGDEYLTIASDMAQHPEPEIVTSVMTDLETLRMPFVTADLEGPFSRYVLHTLSPARQRYGIEPKSDDSEDVRLMRPTLIDWLGEDGRDPDVITYCEGVTEKYMQDPASVDPTIAGAALRVAASDGDQARFEQFRDKLEAATVPSDRSRYMGAMGHFRDPKIQDEVLALALTDKIRVMDRFQLLSGLMDTEAGRDRTYTWMTRNYDKLASGLPVEFRAYFPFMVSGCEQQRLDAAKKFFAEPAHQVDGTERNLEKVSSQISDCLNLREREGKAVATYLKSLAP
ncbi:MAG TPA: M1 family aminopeptidase [Candidatus Krumholzibacteria bacterium]|nr:M1 family aminopeptidase [Candidatus Krumholzibacteria bacterium]